MSDILGGMRAFRAVATSGSFVGGARALSVSTAWASKLVLQLEEHLGAQLLVRTTRRLALTDAGRVYLERCAQVLDDLEEAERCVGDLQTAPRGHMRISAPVSFGLARLAPILPKFHARFPEVELDVVFNDRYVDLIDERIDVAIRVGASLGDSSLIARKMASGERFVCASPAYLRRCGTPSHPCELSDHDCLRYSLHSSPGKWEFRGPGGPVTVEVRGHLQINNSMALRDAARAGAGILLTPDFVVADDLRTKKLHRVLNHWEPSGYNVYALSPPARFGTPKVRAFVEFLSGAFSRSK